MFDYVHVTVYNFSPWTKRRLSTALLHSAERGRIIRTVQCFFV